MSYKVCFLTNQYTPQWNGVARSAARTVNHLANAGMSIHVIVPVVSLRETSASTEQPPLHMLDYVNNPEVDKYGVSIYRVHMPSKMHEMAYLIEFVQLLDCRVKFDLFHGFWLPLAFPALTVAAKGNRPVIGSIRGNDAVKTLGLASRFPFIKAALDSASWITSVSSDLIDSMNAIAPIKNKSSTIYNGIDSSNFPKWSPERKVTGLIGTTGELRYKKGIPILVEAYSKVSKEIRSGLTLIGPFSDESERIMIQRMLKQLEITDECVTPGFMKRPHLISNLSLFNVFVISSFHDGMPNALLEAAACGVPIIATKVGGMLDILKHEDNCLLVDPADVDQLARAITRLLHDESLQKKISVGALELAARLDVNSERDSWISLYDRLLA